MNVVNLLNTIRSNATAEYQSRIPEATKSNLGSIGDRICSYTPATNEFCENLINKIGLTVVNNRQLHNPLAILKKGGIPFGLDVEEIFTNVAKDQGFDGDGTTLLNKVVSETATKYHRLNRQSQYVVSISTEQLIRAFKSELAFNQFLDSIINSLYSGDYYDEFIYTKELISKAVTDGKILTVHVDEVTDDATTSAALLKQIKLAHKNFTIPSINYCSYNKINPQKKFVTFTPTDRQILIMRTDVSTSLDVDVLAGVFNLDKVSLQSMILEIDAFPDNPDLMAVLCDESFFQIYDNLVSTESFRNPKGLYTNYFYNHHQTLSLSPFANAIAFTSAAVSE